MNFSRLLSLTVISIALLLTRPLVHAGSATWGASPATGDWNTATNWMPNTVPNGPADVASFATSSRTTVSLSKDIEVGALNFDAGASAYTIIPAVGVTMTISGAGISNQSGVTQTFFLPTPSNQGGITFEGSAKAGTMTLFTNQTGLGSAGGVIFNDTSSADHATFVNEGRPDETNFDYGVTTFRGTSTAGNATIINNPGLHHGGEVSFQSASTAGSATIICNAGTAPMMQGGVVDMGGNAGGNSTIIVNGSDVAQSGGGLLSAYNKGNTGNATLIANGGALDPGHLQFQPQATGGTSRVELFGNGSLDIIYSAGQPPLTIGSLEGNGLVFLDAANLVIGGNGLSTIFSGVIADTAGGSITKVGAGTLTLSGANTYTGGTTVSVGTLVVANAGGSATGTGAVNVNAGTLGGSGIIGGAVTIGTGSGAGAFLAPATGGKKQLTLTIQSGLTLQADATYSYSFKAKQSKARSDLVQANGVTIKSGAKVNLLGTTEGRLKQGLTLTVISNTSAGPISGAFSNLPEGGIVNLNGNNLQASYHGGGGNDLTLTVVP